MDINLLEKHIYDLECRLLQPEVRQSPERIAELLSGDFFEFCSSGSVYVYKNGDVFDSNGGSSAPEYEIGDFKIELLAPDAVLATYKAIKHHETTISCPFPLFQ